MPPKVRFEWRNSENIDDGLLAKMSELFNSSYGTWSGSGSRPGKPIRLSPARIKEYLNGQNGWAACAFSKKDNSLLAYATVVHFEIPDLGNIAWVTQLVTSTEVRHDGIASKLLESAWCFSDNFAWGLVTPNPLVVRILEKATRRTCHRELLSQHSRQLRDSGKDYVGYIDGKELRSDLFRSLIDTQFHISFDKDPIRPDIWEDVNSRLGALGPGEEWFAFVFGEQERTPITKVEYRALLARYEESLVQAYAGMTLDSKHAWAKHTGHEVEFVLANAKPRIGELKRVLDIGCGTGRHTIELAKRGLEVTAVDVVPELVNRTREAVKAAGVANMVTCICADSRSLNISGKFDLALLLYDVVGSYPEASDNQKLLRSAATLVRSGGSLVLSVMNLELTKSIAKHTVAQVSHPKDMDCISASDIMMRTGDIFNPEHFLLEEDSGVVFRLEQFSKEGVYLPSEILVRDKRYSVSELSVLIRQCLLDVRMIRPVRTGHWNERLDPENSRAKEILAIADRI